MKTVIFSAATLLSAALITGRLSAQDSLSSRDFSIDKPVRGNGTAGASSGSSFAHEASVSTINIHAIKDFKTRFAKVSDEQWSKMDKGFCACFKKDGSITRAYYDRSGHWLASLRYAGESQLPHFIRDVVKRTYYDYTITHVDIIEVPDHVGYLVHLDDNNTLKTVRVSDEGEMEIVSDLKKAK